MRGTGVEVGTGGLGLRCGTGVEVVLEYILEYL